MFLIDDLLLAPFSGFGFIMRTIRRIAEEQYTDDAPLKEELLELQVRYENGEVSEAEYVEAQTEILRALREVQNRKMELAGVNPEEQRGPLSGKVAEGSGVDLHLSYGEQSEKK